MSIPAPEMGQSGTESVTRTQRQQDKTRGELYAYCLELGLKKRRAGQYADRYAARFPDDPTLARWCVRNAVCEPVETVDASLPTYARGTVADGLPVARPGTSWWEHDATGNRAVAQIARADR